MLCASLFTAQVVKWLVGTKAEEREAAAAAAEEEAAEEEAAQSLALAGRDQAILDELAAIRSELALLRSRVGEPAPTDASASGDPRVRWTDERPDAPDARRRSDRSTSRGRSRAPCRGPARRGPAGGRGAGGRGAGRARPVAGRGLPAAARVSRGPGLPGCRRTCRAAHLPGRVPAARLPGGARGACGPQTSSNAIIALILAIVSWAVCPIIPAIVALVLASSAAKEIEASGGRVQGAGLVTARGSSRG